MPTWHYVLPMTQESARDLELVVRQRLRALRTSRGWTLDELAARSHMSASTISRLETGGRRLALDQLRALADALGTSIDELVESPPDDGDVVIRPARVDIDGASVWLLTRPDVSNGLVVTKMRLVPTDQRREPDVHPGRDWFYVLSGTVLLTLGDRQMLVHAGQSAEFATMTPHHFEAHHEPTEVISILDPSGQHARAHLA